MQSLHFLFLLLIAIGFASLGAGSPRSYNEIHGYDTKAYSSNSRGELATDFDRKCQECMDRCADNGQLGVCRVDVIAIGFASFGEASPRSRNELRKINAEVFLSSDEGRFTTDNDKKCRECEAYCVRQGAYPYCWPDRCECVHKIL
ncbi:uncharacterized protein LOC129745381 [Uranotaenia lowii]|uniref:uncharacterized protein LOC129745381 n=1 Tax=Uranotaenia lowii TaxID=190385 RepID=UPI00247A7BB5|nr:uncharacterized protein LOC129745381 [Uranotaenia lowii]